MGFLDKAKEQASALASKAQDAASQGQAKIDSVQAKKRADGLLRDLGAWYYAQRTGRDKGTGTDEIERIHGELRAHEAEHGPLGKGQDDEASSGSSPAEAKPDVPTPDNPPTPIPPAAPITPNPAAAPPSPPTFEPGSTGAAPTPPPSPTPGPGAPGSPPLGNDDPGAP